MTDNIENNWILCCDFRKMVKSRHTQVWVDLPEIVDRLDGKAVSHGYCPECEAYILDELYSLEVSK